MNARTAKALRRIAQEEGGFYQGNRKYYQLRMGQAVQVFFGRSFRERTIRLLPDSVRGIYQDLKKGLRREALNARHGAALIAPRRLRRKTTA